jgi:predicted transcriptional regulator
MRTIDEKVWDYLVNHKKPVTVNQMAKHYIVSQGAVRRALAKLVNSQVVDKIQYGSVVLYKIKD